jgi:hypothetical protein
VSLDVTTGELVPLGGQLTPAQAAERAAWVRDMRKAVLTEGTDYAKLPGTDKPTLLKPGAEMLLLAAGLGFTMSKIEDRDAREHEGVTYKASAHRLDRPDVVVAECEGFAGYDEPRFYKPSTPTKNEYRAPWNTLVKMAQKRALVGAALNATAASGLFIADLDDERDTGTPRPPQRAGKRTKAPEYPLPADAPAAVDGTAELEARLMALSLRDRDAFRSWRKSRKLEWPPTTTADLMAMTAETARIEAEAVYPDYEPPVGSPID